MNAKIWKFTTLGVVLVFGLVAWSPPNSEDLIVGANNTCSSPSGYIGIIGSSNTVNGNNSMIVGANNTLQGPTSRNIIGGSENTMTANNSLSVGNTNTIESTVAGNATSSAAIGGWNQLDTVHGYAVGYNNTVTSDYGHAYGYDLLVENASYCVALGKYNKSMSSNDVVVVGTGTGDAPASRDTSLRATTDGGLILGSSTRGAVVLARAQGDISMGAYSN